MSITSKIETAASELRTVEVPEWLIDGQPLKIHYSPMTVAENKKINKRHPNFMENLLDAEVQVYIIIMKALDSKGDPLFEIGDKSWFDKQEPLVVLRLASLFVSGRTVEELEKN
jgi:hypothetical protein